MRAIDLFSGLGGTTEGARQAGVEVVWAGNHWKLACDTHALNHPGTAHACQDLRQFPWDSLPQYDLLLASPACQGHSAASQPNRRIYHDAMRATAWAVVDCAEVTRPRGFAVENVTTFRRWLLYPDWCSALRRLGYTLTEVIVNAAEHGVPQRRNRLFILGTRNGRIPDIRRTLGGEVPFGPCIDWYADGWRPVNSCRARHRILRAQSKRGPRCLVQHVTGHPGVPLEEPLRTITTKDQWIVVDGDRYRPFTPREYARGMGFPDSYHLPPSPSRANIIRAIGNAVCPPCARDVVTALRAAV